MDIVQGSCLSYRVYSPWILVPCIAWRYTCKVDAIYTPSMSAHSRTKTDYNLPGNESATCFIRPDGLIVVVFSGECMPITEPCRLKVLVHRCRLSMGKKEASVSCFFYIQEHSLEIFSRFLIILDVEIIETHRMPGNGLVIHVVHKLLRCRQ